MTAFEPSPFEFPNHAIIPKSPATFDCSPKGKLIVFDGPDGCGKTSQVAMLSQLFTKMKIRHILMKQPGGSRLGAALRQIFFPSDPAAPGAIGTKNISPDALELLMMANHVQNCDEVAKALAMGVWVISDRWSPSAIAYMAARSANPMIQGWYRQVLERVPWDLFFLLTGDAEKLLRRAQARTGEAHQAEKKWNDVEHARVVVDVFRREFAYLPTTSVIYTDEVKQATVFEYVAEQIKQRFGIDVQNSVVQEVIRHALCQ